MIFLRIHLFGRKRKKRRGLVLRIFGSELPENYRFSDTSLTYREFCKHNFRCVTITTCASSSLSFSSSSIFFFSRVREAKCVWYLIPYSTALTRRAACARYVQPRLDRLNASFLRVACFLDRQQTYFQDAVLGTAVAGARDVRHSFPPLSLSFSLLTAGPRVDVYSTIYLNNSYSTLSERSLGLDTTAFQSYTDPHIHAHTCYTEYFQTFETSCWTRRIADAAVPSE